MTGVSPLLAALWEYDLFLLPFGVGVNGHGAEQNESAPVFGMCLVCFTALSCTGQFLCCARITTPFIFTETRAHSHTRFRWSI
jgi:hypothetical protein